LDVPTLSTQEQNALVTETLDLVSHVVSELAVRYPRHVDRAELWNAGALGLVEASRRYNPEAEIPFARYAAIRIRGSIIDSTRNRDWATRSVRRHLREIQQAAVRLEEQTGVAPSQVELAGCLGITVADLTARQAQASVSTLLHLDTADPEETSLAERVEEERIDAVPELALEQRELRGTLQTAVRHLPPVQAEVISRYYLRGELLQDVAEDMGLTTARVSQIRSEALDAMRSFFATQYEGVNSAPDAAPGKKARAAYVTRVAESTTWRSRLDTDPTGLDLTPLGLTG
jgi:RNA polymerase sigma factor for flagellar operon FliA